MSSSEVLAIVVLAVLLGMLMMGMMYGMLAAMRADSAGEVTPRSEPERAQETPPAPPSDLGNE